MKNSIYILRRLFTTTIIVLGITHASAVFGATKGQGMIMSDKYQQITVQLCETTNYFDTSALYLIEKNIEQLTTAKNDSHSIIDKGERKKALELWLKAIATLDRLLDPYFDPEDLPQINIMPPPETGLSSGAAPSAIKDEKLREKYEQAIELNIQKGKRYNAQLKLRELDKAWSGKMISYIQNHYTDEASDLSEINLLIEKCIQNEPRKERIRELLLYTEVATSENN